MSYNDFKDALVKVFVGKFLVWGKLYLGECLNVEKTDDEKDYFLLCQRATAVNPGKVLVDYSWHKHGKDLLHVLKPFDTESLAGLYIEVRED